MVNRTLSSHKLLELTALAGTSARKAKASVTLSGNLLKVIDTLAGPDQRSAWIERAVRAYAKRQLKGYRRVRELELLNRHAKELNAEGDASAEYQATWDAE
jgi:metal-responsive CopG/Arc/MetJ family transcriptional regulator